MFGSHVEHLLLLQQHIEMYSICLAIGCDGEIHEPPAAHLELSNLPHDNHHSPNIESRVDWWESMSVLRHVAVHSDSGIFDGRAIGAFHMQSPFVHLIDGDRPIGCCVRHPI